MTHTGAVGNVPEGCKQVRAPARRRSGTRGRAYGSGCIGSAARRCRGGSHTGSTCPLPARCRPPPSRAHQTRNSCQQSSRRQGTPPCSAGCHLHHDTAYCAHCASSVNNVSRRKHPGRTCKGTVQGGAACASCIDNLCCGKHPRQTCKCGRVWQRGQNKAPSSW